MRRRSGANFEELLSKEWSILTKNEQQEIQHLYKRTEQRNGGISFYDMINILQTIGLSIDQNKKDKINRDLQNKQIRIIDINVVFSQAASVKKDSQENEKGQHHEKGQYLDAFVALGGHHDSSGFIRKNTLIETMKNEFQLTFDIETFLDNVQGESLDYTSFCSIFEEEKEIGERLASSVSQRTHTEESTRTLVIDERDFQKYMEQYEHD